MSLHQQALGGGHTAETYGLLDMQLTVLLIGKECLKALRSLLCDLLGEQETGDQLPAQTCNLPRQKLEEASKLH